MDTHILFPSLSTNCATYSTSGAIKEDVIDLTKGDIDCDLPDLKGDDDDGYDCNDDDDDDDDADDAVAVAERKWLRTLDEYDGYNPATHVDIPQQPIEEPATTGQPPPLLQAAAAHIEKPATTGQPPPLLQAAAAHIVKPATTGQPPPLRRAGSRQPAPDHSGQPCGCGCGKQLEQKDYKNCHTCVNKDPSTAYNKIRVSCWGGGIPCTVCRDTVTRYNMPILPAVTSQHILYYCTYYSVSFTCTVHCTYYTYCTLYI